MADEPVVKVKVVLDDSEAQKTIANLAAQITKAFSKTPDINLGRVGDQLNNIANNAQALATAFDKAQKGSAGSSAGMREMSASAKAAADQMAKLAAAHGKQIDAAKAAREAQRTGANLSGLNRTLFDLGKGLSKAQAGIFAFNNTLFALNTVIAIVGGAIRGVWEALEQGAIVNTTTAAFERLSTTLIQVPNLLDQLRLAAKGTVSDFSLMQQTLTLVQGAAPELAKELGRAAPQLLEIARASAILNPALGSAEQNFARLALGIRRSSVRILDDIGLIIRLQQAYDEFAVKVGKNVLDLDAQEKQLALLNSTVKEGQNLINALGDSVSSQVDPFQQWDAAVQNLTNNFKAGFIGVVLPTLRTFSDDYQRTMEGITASTAEAAQAAKDPLRPLSEGIDQALALTEEAMVGFGKRIAAIMPNLARESAGFTENISEMIRVAGQTTTTTEFTDFLDETLAKLEQLQDFRKIEFFDAIVEGALASGASIQELNNILDEVFTQQELLQVATTLLERQGLEAVDTALAMQLLQERLEAMRQAQSLLAQDQKLGQLHNFWMGLSEVVGLTEDQLESLMKTWDIGIGKGMPENVAALAVAMGTMTEAEAEAEVAAFRLTAAMEALLRTNQLTGLTTDQQTLALHALSTGLVDTAADALKFAAVMSQIGGQVEEAMLEAAQGQLEAAATAKQLSEAWQGVDLGAEGLSENAARMNVALGRMTQAEADAAIQAFNLHTNFRLLSESVAFNALTFDQQVVAFAALQTGMVSNVDAAVAYVLSLGNITEAQREAAIEALKAAGVFDEVAKAVNIAAEAVSNSAQEFLKTKGAAGEMAAEFIKVATAAGASVEQILAMAEATGLLSEAELQAVHASLALASVQESLAAAVKAGTISLAEAISLLVQFANASVVAANAIGGLAGASKGFGTFVSELNSMLGGGGGGGGGLIDSVTTFRDTFIDAISSIGEAQENLDKAIAEGESEEKIEELTKALGEASGATRNWKKELFDLTIEAGASVEQIIALGVATGILNEKQAQAAFKQAAAAAAIEKIAQAYVAGSISAEDAAAAVGDVQKAIAAGGDIDLSQFGISVGDLASKTAEAGRAAGGAAKETKTWRDSLLDLADAEGTTAEQAVALARESGKFTEEQINSALQTDAMSKAVEALGTAMTELSVDEIVSQLESLESVIGQLSTDELALFLDLGVEFDLTPGEVAEAVKAFLGGDMTIEQAIDVVFKARARVDFDVTGGLGSGEPLDIKEIPKAILDRGGISGLPAEEVPGGFGGGGGPNEVAIDITADGSAAQATIDRIEGELTALAAEPTVPTIDADSGPADDKLASVNTELDNLDAREVSATVDADTSPAEAALAAFISNAEATTVTIPVEFEVSNVPAPPGASADDTASRGARVLPGDVILVGDSGRPNPAELFVTDEYLASGGRNNIGINEPRVIGQNGPMFFESSVPGFVLPYVPSSFDAIQALADMIGVRDGVGTEPAGFGRIEDYDSMEAIIDAIKRGANWSVQDFLNTGRFEFFPTVYDAYSRKNKRRYSAEPPGFSEGGFTGSEGGIVHANEYVFDAAATANLGVATLEALHLAAHSTQGLAEALGLVQPSLFGMPASTYDGADGQSTVINNRQQELTINVANPKQARIIMRREIGAIA